MCRWVCVYTPVRDRRHYPVASGGPANGAGSLNRVHPAPQHHIRRHDSLLRAEKPVVDGKAGSVGSANRDVRSFRLNFEANAFFYDAAVGAGLVRAFEEDLAFSTEITPEDYRARSLRVRVKEAVSGLFLPLG